MSIAAIAKASAKTSEMIMAVKILGALEGFLPKAFMLAKLLTAKTAAGPNTHKENNISIVRFLPIGKENPF